MNAAQEAVIANAIAQAIDTLDQLNCSYTITNADGAVITNIKPRHKKRNDFSALNITERLRGSSIGDEVFFECPEGVDPIALQASVCGHAGKVFGSKKNYKSRADRERNGVVVTCGVKKPVDLSAVLKKRSDPPTPGSNSLQ